MILDIETAPNIAYVWGAFKQNVGADFFIEPTYMMSCASKWLGEDEIFYEDTQHQTEDQLLEHVVGKLDEADFVVAHNGARFDLPRIRGRCLVNGVKPYSPVKVIDTLLIARREFGFTMNSLKYLAKILGCEDKSSHAKFPGFELWLECLKRNPEAWAEMKAYNIQDIVTLEEIYIMMRPYSSTHVNVNTGDEDNEELSCTRCGSHNLHKRGFYHTNVAKNQRYQCQDCGAWSATRVTENTIEKRKSLLKSI